MKVGFSAKAGSGKSTVVNYLIEKYSGTEVKFAEPLYKSMYAVQDALGIERHKDGLLLQVLGTEWGRAKDPNFWVNQFVNSLPDGNVFCSDARFPNEVEALKKEGFLVIRLERSIEDRKEYVLNRDTNHPSETALDNYTFEHVLYNDGTLEDLYKQVDQLLFFYIARKYL